MVPDLKIRVFEPKDMARILELANTYATFDGTISEADLIITNFFPAGFWVAEEDNQVVGFAYGHFKEIPGEVLVR